MAAQGRPKEVSALLIVFLNFHLFFLVLLKTLRDFMPQFASVSSLGQHPALGQVPLDAKLEDISPISATEVGMC